MDNQGSYLVLGCSQSGKSSFINLLAGGPIADVGNGDGCSVTNRLNHYTFISGYINSLITLIDIPGFGDSRLFLSDDQIKELVKFAICESFQRNTPLKGFIIIESLANDAITLINTLQKLYSIVSPQAGRSTVILANKFDLVPDRRFTPVQRIANQANIPIMK